MGNKFEGLHRKTFDGELITVLEDVLQKDSLQVIFIHMMGSHEDFKERYPKTFNHFSQEDYSSYPENQKKTRAEYDNTILYSDYVVSQMMHKCDQEEAIVIYFSDHGLDIYETDPDYFGHAKGEEASVNACYQIPFMIYLTPRFRENWPNTVLSIENNRDKSFLTENLIYTFMDIIGVDFVDNEDVKHYSLLRP